MIAYVLVICTSTLGSPFVCSKVQYEDNDSCTKTLRGLTPLIGKHSNGSYIYPACIPKEMMK